MLTLGNVLAGSIGVYFLLTDGDAWLVAMSMLIGMLCDGFDGLSARLVGASSEIGKELDSLADMITFGVLPGFMLFVMLVDAYDVSFDGIHWPSALGLLLIAASALRLAKFNVVAADVKYFVGLATPSCAAMVMGIYWWAQHDTFGTSKLILTPWFLYAATAILSFLLVSKVPMFSYKGKAPDLLTKVIRYGFAISTIVMLLWFGFVACPVIILIYILLSFIWALVTQPHKSTPQPS